MMKTKKQLRAEAVERLRRKDRSDKHINNWWMTLVPRFGIYDLDADIDAIIDMLQEDESPYDELLRHLENDWNISASWDGLRKFWSIELTEEGVRMRDERNRLEAERDEWKAKAEGFTEALEKLGCSVLANGTVFEGSSKVRVGSSNLEWLVENDREALLDLIDCRHIDCCKECAFDKYDTCGITCREWLMAPHDGSHSKAHSKTETKLSELFGILSDANTPQDMDSGVNVRMCPNDSREKINALRAYYGAGPTAMTDEQIAAGLEVYGASKDVDMVIVDELHDSREKLEADVHAIANNTYWESMVIGWLDRQASITANELTSESDAPKPAETAENGTSKDDIRDFGDSREKLEADVRKNLTLMNLEEYVFDMIHCWLDRQEAITEREVLCHPDERDEQIAELQAELYELRKTTPQGQDGNLDQSQVDWLRLMPMGWNGNDVIAELESELAKRQKGVNRLKRRRDELGAKVSLLTAENVALQASVDRLTASTENLARDLDDSERLREELREKLSRAIDCAHEITMLTDMGCC